MSDKKRNMLHIPISNDGEAMRSIVLYVPLPLTQPEWDQFMDVLMTMSPAIVEPARPVGAAEDLGGKA